jgi:hypothetical protein
MLNWITGVIGAFVNLIPSPIRQLVHYVVHGLAAVVNGVFGHVLNAWRGLASFTVSLGHQIEDFAFQVAAKFIQILHVTIPAVEHWVERGIAAVVARIAAVLAWAVREFGIVRAWVTALLVALWHLVLRDVYDPLFAFATWLKKYLLLWGYTAWWYITHPASLAELLILPLADSLERHAWELAGKLGTFLLALVVKNLKHVLQLAEDILSAVL